MKRNIVICMALAFASAYTDEVSKSIDANSTKPCVKQEQTPRRTRSRKHLGGFLIRPAKGKSVCFANAQTLVPEATLKSTAAEMSKIIGINLVVSQLPNGNVNPMTLRDGQTAAVVVVRASDDANGSTMIVAPENAWAIIDVSALAKDKPSSEILAERVRKELWRATAIMLGASDSNFRPCLLEPVHSLSDLDRLKASQVCPEPFGNIQRNARDLGCGSPVYTSYRQACREGWAPAPTNDVQRAIWKEVHSIPDKPITIEFDPKKDK